ncbi:hypothetical protein RSAG8_09548, partial [Rhizoctonia solani AG-8 WAC10335]
MHRDHERNMCWGVLTFVRKRRNRSMARSCRANSGSRDPYPLISRSRGPALC